MHHSLLPAVLSLSVLLSTLVAAQDASYTFTAIDVPGAGYTVASGINTAGQIVGSFEARGRLHGFLTDGATITTFDVPGAPNTIAQGINDAGVIVGWSNDGTNRTHGFLIDGTTFTPIDVPGAVSTQALGINAVGQIVGTFFDGTKTHGFLMDGPTFTTLDIPGAREMAAQGINTEGQIVGWFDAAIDAFHGFLRDGTTLTTFDVPGATKTFALGINTDGQIVGWFSDVPERRHGFLMDGTTFTTLDVPGATLTVAYGINTAGQIVGSFSDGTRDHGFLATPVEVDMSPPVITVSASPTTLWPPNGKRVAVTVAGTITDTEPGGSGVKAGSAAYVVMDEYGQIQPRGSLTLGANGRYSVTVALEASRNGNDQDGRHYTIAVSAKDNAGSMGFASTIVTVPHDQGQHAGASLTACGRICE